VPQLRWEACKGMIGRFYPPREEARKVVPAAFNLEPALLPQTANFLFEAVHCERIATGEKVYEEQSLFRILVDVRPKNQSWGSSTSSYATDVLISSRDAAAAASVLGVPARVATLTRSSVPAGSGTLEQWTYTGEGFTADIQFATKGEQIDGGRMTRTTWHDAEASYHKLSVDLVYGLDALLVQSGVLRLTGPFGAAPALPAECCIEWAGGPYTQWAEVWTGNSTKYAET
jgi:hypothetical protein